MASGSGYGKVILLNDHFVVYHVPAMAAALSLKTQANVEPRSDSEIVVRDERKGTAGYTEAKKAQQKESIRKMLDLMEIDGGMDVWLGGDLPVKSGLGCSAASSAAIVRAASFEYSKRLGDIEINAITYEMERAFAGNPSGIDNTAAVYGGMFWFNRAMSGDGRGYTVQPIKTEEPIKIVIGDTGKVADTKAMVDGVAERRKTDPNGYYKWLFRKAHDLANEGLGRFGGRMAKSNLRYLGHLMDINHGYLHELGVSSKELDELVGIARKAGAYGAKMTGGGGGGCMVALTPEKELQEAVARAFEEAGYESLCAEVG